MPELPEVETIARGLAKRVRGDVVESVWIGQRRQPLKSRPAEIVRVLEGASIAAVRRVGKHIVFDLERTGVATSRDQWIVHLGMTGRVLVASASDEMAKHTHAVVRLRSGRELRYVDPRMFGKLSVARGEGFAAAGREPLDVEFVTFAALFRGRRTPIKSALLNQKLLSGIGNIYADESLARAGVRPRRQAAKVTRAELQRLYAAMRQVLAEAIAAGGSSVSDYVDADGEEGFFQLEHRVYGREGEPCRICRTAIRRIVIGGRSSHFCPKCQK
jgi:formamidopyrimidine-DNA glycosylase